jgi:hypothetical protein
MSESAKHDWTRIYAEAAAIEVRTDKGGTDESRLAQAEIGIALGSTREIV